MQSCLSFPVWLNCYFSSSFSSCCTGEGVQCDVRRHGESRRPCLWEEAFTLPPLNIAVAVRFPVECFPQSPRLRKYSSVAPRT